MSAELKARIASLVDALVHRDEERCESDFVHLVTRARDLVDRKRAMEGTKTDTRDLLGELLFSRVRRGMRTFLKTDDARAEIRAAEWVIGTLFSVTTMSELAAAFDQALLANGTPRDFNFAGRTDFISVEEVLQMLAAGKHRGCLCLEKADNRLDIYLRDGRIAFLDPHHLIRRVLPTSDPMRYREIPASAVATAEQERAKSSRPVFLSLCDQGLFKVEELREMMRFFGQETLYDFMRDRDPYAFFYRRMDGLPQHVEQHDLRIGVTSVLLEGSKRVDDWQQMVLVFPNADKPLEPTKDMYARMGDVALGVMELKLLTSLNGDTTPRSLAPQLGLPLFDVYQMLIHLAREGILAPQSDVSVLENLTMSLEESMQEAFAVLDANDDQAQRASALDRVLGDEGKRPAGGKRPDGGGGAGGAAGPGKRAGDKRAGGAGGALDRILGG